MLTKIILLFMGAMGMPNNDLKSAILSLIIAALYFCAIIQHIKSQTHERLNTNKSFLNEADDLMVFLRYTTIHI